MKLDIYAIRGKTPCMKTAILLFFMTTSLTYAQNQLPQIERFNQDQQYMPETGVWKGKIMEHDLKRSVMILEAAEKRMLSLDEAGFYFANYVHDGKLYIAKLKGVKMQDGKLQAFTGKSSEIYFVKEKWAAKSRPLIKELEAHTSLQVKFPAGNGIELIYQQSLDGYLTKLKQSILIDFTVISIEGMRPQDQRDAAFEKYAAGLHFGIGYRMYSLNENLRRRGNELKDYEDLYYQIDRSQLKTNSNADPGLILIYNSARTSSNHNRNGVYNLFTNNCTNRAFDLLDLSFGYKKANFKMVAKQMTKATRKQAPALIKFLGSIVEDKVDDFSKEIKSSIDPKLIEKADVKVVEFHKRMQEFLKNPETYQGLEQYLNDNLIVIGPKDQFSNVVYSIPLYIEPNLEARGILKGKHSKTY